MLKDYPDNTTLKQQFGRNKVIPGRYETPVLRALYYYPELADMHIEVKPVRYHPLPYSTSPVVWSLLKGPRKYRIYLREQAPAPHDQALFSQLPPTAQMGVIGHELAHILQYEGKTPTARLSQLIAASRGSLRRESERRADITAIERGLGFELYTFAAYIRSIEGYLEAHPDLDVLYLHPNEILEALPADELRAINNYMQTH